MMRGTGRTFRRGAVYWIAYWHRGREYRESARSPRRADAIRLLKQRLGEIHGHRFIGPQVESVTFEDLVTGYVDDYRLQGYRSLDSAARPRAQLTRSSPPSVRRGPRWSRRPASGRARSVLPSRSGGHPARPRESTGAPGD